MRTDDPTEFSEVKLVLRSAKTGYAKVKLNTKECPLEWYFHRRLLTQPMYEAGCLFRRDFEIASVGRVTAVDWDRVFGSGQRDLTDGQLDAMRRISKALRAMSRRSGSMALTICGAGLSAADYERAMKWKKGYGLERLREALNELAEHKGLITLN